MQASTVAYLASHVYLQMYVNDDDDEKHFCLSFLGRSETVKN